MNRQFDCIVIGGGHNGLTTAAYLAKQGRKVVVYEKNERCGGIARGHEFHPGFFSPGLVHDTSLVRQQIVNELQLEKHGLKVESSPAPLYLADENGPGILLSSDSSATHKEIAQYSRTDADQYDNYRKFFQRIAPFMRKVFDNQPPQVYAINFYGLMDLMTKAVSLRKLGRKDMMEMLRIGPMCVADWLNEWFENEILKAGLAGPAVFGSFAGPWSPSTNANLLLHECMAMNHVVGGPAALTSALESACKSLGVTIVTGRPVGQLKIERQVAKGIVLDDGEEVLAKVVASSINPKTTFLELARPGAIPFQLENRMRNLRARGTTAKLNLALSKRLAPKRRPDLFPIRFRTGGTLDTIEKAFDTTKYSSFSDKPILDAYMPSNEDRSSSPDKNVWSVMIHFAAYDEKTGWSAESRQELTQATLAELGHHFDGLEDAIVAKELLTPTDLSQKYDLVEGQINHAEHAADQILARPTPETFQYSTPIAGLFLNGSGSHPGGGITCAPGRLAAEAISQSL